jgi:hypothetical protein
MDQPRQPDRPVADPSGAAAQKARMPNTLGRIDVAGIGSNETMNDERPDYFAAAPSIEDAVLRRIKGNFRRKLVLKGLQTGDLASIPQLWQAHDISENLKNVLTSINGPQGRGGEDLPDLDQGEVEIARLSLVDSVHGEVTSLRAKHDPRDLSICLSMVDEYGTTFELPDRKVSAPLTAEEVLVTFRDAEPTPTDTSCQIEFGSFFYPNLDSLATEMGIKPATIDSPKKGAQTTYGAKNKLVTAEEAKSARARLRKTISELDMGAPHKATGKKDYAFAVIGVIAFCIGLSFTQAGRMLLQTHIPTPESVLRAFVYGCSDAARWAFWAAVVSYSVVSIGSVRLFIRTLKRSEIAPYSPSMKWRDSVFGLGLIRLFILPLIHVAFLAWVLGAFVAAMVGKDLALLTPSFVVIMKTSALAFGLYLLLAAFGQSGLKHLKYSGFQLVVMGTVIIGQLSIPEKLIGGRDVSPTTLYPGFLGVSLCWAFAGVACWISDIASNLLFTKNESMRALVDDIFEIIIGFVSLSFLVEYARLAGS